MHDVVDELRLISDELARVDPPTASQLDALSERVYRLAEIIADEDDGPETPMQVCPATSRPHSWVPYSDNESAFCEDCCVDFTDILREAFEDKGNR